MIYDHHTHPNLLERAVRIDVAGCGGSGSLMLTGLARLNQALRALGHPGLHITAVDPDDVSTANLGRQMFAPCDVGRNKAEVLITRLNGWYGTRWTAVPEEYDYAHQDDWADIVITCLDTAAGRVEVGCDMARVGRQPLYWMDLGNRAADGQVVLGIPAWNPAHKCYPFRLPTVLELFPEIGTDTRALDKNNGPSCSLAEALERQELFINQLVATQALQLLWQIFRHGKTHWHGAFVNASNGRITPLPVDPDAWARMGYVRPTPPTTVSITSREHS